MATHSSILAWNIPDKNRQRSLAVYKTRGLKESDTTECTHTHTHTHIHVGDPRSQCWWGWMTLLRANVPSWSRQRARDEPEMVHPRSPGMLLATSKALSLSWLTFNKIIFDCNLRSHFTPTRQPPPLCASHSHWTPLLCDLIFVKTRVIHLLIL